MIKANFIDIDVVLKTESRPWIVSKDSPNVPLMKIEQYDFKLFKSGIYKSQNNKIEFNGQTFWLPNEFMNKVKITAKKSKADLSNLAISMQEFLNPNITEDIKYKIDLSIFNGIINTNDDIYIICSKNNKKNYEKQIKKLEESLSDIGLTVKNYYFISETFYNRDEDDISFTKIKLLLQHLIGLKADGDKISEEDITNYDRINFYDDSRSSIQLAKNINLVLEKMLINTDNQVKVKVKERIRNIDNILTVKEYTHNNINKYNETIVTLEYSNVIRSFENFKF